MTEGGWLAGNGEAISKETMAEWKNGVGKNDNGDVDKKEITEEFEEINIDTGELVKGCEEGTHRNTSADWLRNNDHC